MRSFADGGNYAALAKVARQSCWQTYDNHRLLLGTTGTVEALASTEPCVVLDDGMMGPAAIAGKVAALIWCPSGKQVPKVVPEACECSVCMDGPVHISGQIQACHRELTVVEDPVGMPEETTLATVVVKFDEV